MRARNETKVFGDENQYMDKIIKTASMKLWYNF